MLILRCTSFVTVALSLTLTLTFAGVASAQSTGTLTGTVVDETGGVLPGVTVDVQAAGTRLDAVTDDTGTWRVEGVPEGPASLTFRLVNFSTLRRDLEVASGENREDVVLALGLAADVVVTGSRTFRNIADLENPRENLVGVATSASVGAITAEQLEARPIMRPGEVLEAVPGFITSQHSGEGKANQYYLRGFNLDHGSDFATTLAGVPMNESSGAHAHGYSDVNLLIPELVSGVQYTKGPYFAEHGDFSAAGSANISYLNVLDRPMLSVSSGGQGWGRVFGAVSPQVGAGNVLMALEMSRNDGPWELPDDLRKTNAVVRYSQGNLQNGFSITGMGYSADWNATDQIPLRAVETRGLSRFGNIDPTDAGRTFRYSLAFDGLQSSGTGSTRLTAYTLQGGLNLFQNFTCFLEHPTRRRPGRAGGPAVGLRGPAGAPASGQRFRPAAGGRRRSIAPAGRGRHGRPVQHCRQTAYQHHSQRRGRSVHRRAVRSDRDRMDPRLPDDPRRSGRLLPLQGGRRSGPQHRRGHVGAGQSQAHRGVGPVAGDRALSQLRAGIPQQRPAGRNDGGRPGHRRAGGERGPARAGARCRDRPAHGRPAGPAVDRRPVVPGVRFRADFVGDAGIAEASRPSRRLGVEWTNYVRPASWLTGELDVSLSRARFSDFDPAGDFIPGALDRVIAGAITVTPLRRVFGSVRLRHFGPRPLIEDNSVQSKATTIWNGEIGIRINERLDIVLEGFNLLNSDVSDIDYFYTSRLPGEPADGIDDIHFHPSIPRTARVMLRRFLTVPAVDGGMVDGMAGRARMAA